MISNPCSWFAGGGSYDSIRKFEYEGGKRLYHFCCSGKRGDENLGHTGTGWTDHWVAVNVVFFANDEEHARDVFRRMLEFYLECAREQSAYYHGNTGVHHKDFHIRISKTAEMVQQWLGKIDEAVFTEAPTNQLFTVGWASNDTIFY